MSKDKYMSMFLHKIEAIVFIILQIFCNANKKNCLQTAICLPHKIFAFECSLV